MTTKRTPKQPTEKQLARAAKKEAEALALATAIDAAAALLKPPSSLSACGIVKTRCWAVLHDKLSHQIRLKRPNRLRLENLAASMRSWETMDAEAANQLGASLKGGAL